MAKRFEQATEEKELSSPKPVRSPRTPKKGALAARFNLEGKIDLKKMKPGAYDPCTCSPLLVLGNQINCTHVVSLPSFFSLFLSQNQEGSRPVGNSVEAIEYHWRYS